MAHQHRLHPQRRRLPETFRSTVWKQASLLRI